jgi:hypothetical protein
LQSIEPGTKQLKRSRETTTAFARPLYNETTLSGLDLPLNGRVSEVDLKRDARKSNMPCEGKTTVSFRYHYRQIGHGVSQSGERPVDASETVNECEFESGVDNLVETSRIAR